MRKRNRTSELVVKPRQPIRTKVMAAAFGVVVTLLVVFGVYRYGLKRAGFESVLASQVQSSLQEQIDELKKENQDLRDSLARAERSQQMNETAYAELNQTLKQSAQDAVRLREEISFYKNILSPDNKIPGIRVQSLQIKPGDKDTRFHYKLVVIQALKHDRNIRGSARFEIAGLQAGKDTVLQFPQRSRRAIGFNFKYFQDLEGDFDLPAAFEPHKIKVTVTTTGRNGKTIEKEYPWPEKRA
jgi:hypothetical protein